MKWHCPTCSSTPTTTHAVACPECCGFRAAAQPDAWHVPGRVRESADGSWVPDRHRGAS